MNLQNIFTKEEKKVSYLELIYDLIFVYMVGRDNALLENIENGFIAPFAFIAYISCALSIIQIWTFTTFYINMFGRNGLREHIFLLVNMYLMYFVGEATRADARGYVGEYHIAWGLILANIALQYLLELRNHETDVWNRDIIAKMSRTIFIEAALVLIAAFLPVIPSLILSNAAIAAGIILTYISRSSSVGGQVDFMHLTERAELYVIFTFGEMVIAIAGYFTSAGHYTASDIYYSLLTFVVAAGLFTGYEIVYDYLVDREMENGGMQYMMIHIFIVFALNNITVSFEFMREPEIENFPKTLMLTLSLIGYFIFLFLLGRYFKLHCRFDWKLKAKMFLLSATFAVAMILLRNVAWLTILITVVYVFAVFFALYGMKKMQDQAEKAA